MPVSRGDGGPAFPIAFTLQTRDGETQNVNEGMSYRQWLIGQYLCGAAGDGDHLYNPDKEAETAIAFADAIIKKLAEEDELCV